MTLRCEQTVAELGLPSADHRLVFNRQGCRTGRAVLLKYVEAEQVSPARLELMLALAFRCRLPPLTFEQFMSALESSQRGDHAIANLRLALAGLSQVPHTDNLHEQIAMVDTLLNGGMRPDELFAALDLGDEASLTKFDPNQPRVPAGSGGESGRWTAEGRSVGGSTSASAGTMAIALRAAPLLAPALGETALAALSFLAAGVGFGVVLGVLVVPSPNSVSSSGPLPGNSGTRYDYNHDEGVLRVLDADGAVLAAGQKDKSGVFFDADTGVPFARDVGGSLVFDGAAMAAVKEADDVGAIPAAVPQTHADEQEPKLCPDPGADQPGSEYASKRAKEYQEQISRMINPQRPLEYGLAMNLINPLSGKLVHYDECDERTGTMIEAKGPGFDRLLGFPQGADSVDRDWLKQSFNEVQAAGSRQVVWYFAEDRAAQYAKQLFVREGGGRDNIVVRVQPADNP